MKILGISGGLRTASVNTALLRTAATLTPHGVTLTVYEGLGNLPHFNPELDKEPLPLAVTDFRSQLHSSDGVIISSPEYAHGIPGVLKNALDWLVASGELYEKPVTLFNVSSRTSYGQASLAETLTVMAARIIPEASINTAQATGQGELQMCSNADLPKENRMRSFDLCESNWKSVPHSCVRPQRAAFRGLFRLTTMNHVPHVPQTFLEGAT